MTAERDMIFARKGRITASVIAVAGISAMLAPWLVHMMGWPVRFEILIYFASLAAFIWAMVNIYQLWRLRQIGAGIDMPVTKSKNQR